MTRFTKKRCGLGVNGEILSARGARKPMNKKEGPMAAIPLEQRVAALEAEMAQVKATLEDQETAIPWWKQIKGAFANDPAFEEAMRLGRKYRESFRPKAAKRGKR
jgi:hypothetical protein